MESAWWLGFLQRLDGVRARLRPWARPAFHVVAVAEALSWIGLLAGMWRAYVSGDGRAGIELFGPIHGAVFVAFVAVTVVAAWTLRWQVRTVVLALAAAVPPLATVMFDVIASRRGWLRDQGAVSAVGGTIGT